MSFSRVMVKIVVVFSIILSACSIATRPPPPEPVLTRQQMQQQKDVSQIQTLLEQRGFNPGPVDGVVGPQLTAAAKEFQSIAGLQVHGEIDQYLLQSLINYPRSLNAVAVAETIGADPKYWAFAGRRNSIGNAWAVGETKERASARALDKCNRKKGHNVNTRGIFFCTTVAVFSLEEPNCAAIVHGFIPATSFSTHFGRSSNGDSNPLRTALERATNSCRSQWSGYASSACRSFNGGASNATKTSYSYCTSDILREITNN